jgi:DNA repair protein RadA/Sms
MVNRAKGPTLSDPFPMLVPVARLRSLYRCTECGASSPKWGGRCATCGEWNSLVEEIAEVRPGAAGVAGAPPAAVPVPITDVGCADGAAVPTGVPELDRVLGGGLVAGSVTLVGGEPGIGKSTLLLQVAAARARAGARALYVSAEESAQQVSGRAERLGALHADLWLLSETVLPHVLAAVDHVKPDLVIVDSIQTVVDPEIGSAPGSVTQVRECAHRLVHEAKQRGVAVVLVGHVNKEGGLAGPRVLEHVVDTVLAFEGDRHHALRLLRAVKHRYGPTAELGVFEMTEAGITGVADPSGLFLADRRQGIAGSAVVPIVEGQRPLLVEVQALVAPSPLALPRRSAQGFDQGRLSLLLAVLERRAGLSFAGTDVYASAVGGVRLAEPGSDLGLCLALASSLVGDPVPPGLVACGEVGLGGELRQAAQTPRRLAEAARLGFTTAIVPVSAPNGVPGIRVLRAGTLAEALDLATLTVRDRTRSDPV